MLNWDEFARLPGAPDTNFEMLCRALMRRHYGKYGNFSAEANQAGIEFDLKLESDCSLGKGGRWFGWQCRWYELPSGRAIGTTRRAKIEDAIRKTETDRPGITDWVLWTRHTLTAGDQAWVRAIRTRLSLHLWTSVEAEEYLNGPAEIFRSTYFGSLVLTPERLDEEHAKSITRIQRRWQPEVHQIVDIERSVRDILLEPGRWTELREAGARLNTEKDQLLAAIKTFPKDLLGLVADFAQTSIDFASQASDAYAYLAAGDIFGAAVTASSSMVPSSRLDKIIRRLRSTRNSAALVATNMLADMHLSHYLLDMVDWYISINIVAVTGDAGYGKTEMAASLSSKSGDRPSGVLLHGTDLAANQNLDDLARRVVIQGQSVASFEALAAAVDAAGRRAGRRIPIVIDGLNEAEDPRIWKNILASLPPLLKNMPYVIVVCTLRSAFADEALPDDIPRLHTQGFGRDIHIAIKRYFDYYKIDATDALIPVEMLQHPLTLRIFCEVANPERRQPVGVGAIPASLTTLFTLFLKQAAARIAELAPRSHRYYEADISAALFEIGRVLWEHNARSVEIATLRQLLGDQGRPWDESIVRALEHDGILLRTPGDRPGTGHVSVVYDLLAGHIIADAILIMYPGHTFATWIHDNVERILPNNRHDNHPLSTDIFQSLVGTVPVRLYGQHLWKHLDGKARSQALYEASLLESSLIDRETLNELHKVFYQSIPEARDLFNRLWVTRAAQPHPLDADFLDTGLRRLSMADRDLLWTEWLRDNHLRVLSDIKGMEKYWQSVIEPGKKPNRHRAIWLMWTLTSTVTTIRDHATRALYNFGCSDPQALFDLASGSLSINDPYIGERMLAACYGVAMALWADPQGDLLRTALPTFANTIIDMIFVPGAPYPTHHVLSRDYALGNIALALKVAPDCIAKDKLPFIQPPFTNLSIPFADPSQITDAEIKDAERAIGMDFGNYTIGQLVEGRRNYDYENADYKNIVRQIEKRIVDLGYSFKRFSDIDETIRERSWRAESEHSPMTDRYGQKYSRIAYFEMYGVRDAASKIDHDYFFERAHEADIDPSFPEAPKSWSPAIPDIFDGVPDGVETWMVNGPIPDFEHLLTVDKVDGEQGPWVIIDGRIGQEAKSGGREVFTHFNTIFVKPDDVDTLNQAYSLVDHPSNSHIPNVSEDTYTYAGEVPWSPRFGNALRTRNGKAKRCTESVFSIGYGPEYFPGVSAEIPVSEVRWAGSTSPANHREIYRYLAPALCARLKLSGRKVKPDLYDAEGKLATIYRVIKGATVSEASYLLYLRADLVSNYLHHTKQILVVLAWGERGYSYRHPLGQINLYEYYSKNQQIHKKLYTMSSD